MIVYWSMLAWIIFWWVVYNLINQNCRWKKPPFAFVAITYGYITFWTGMRSGFADTGTYIAMFNSLPSKLSEYFNSIDLAETKSIGYEILQVAFKQFISQDYHVWLMCIAAISIICIVYVIYNESDSFFFSTYLFMTLLVFMWLFNGMRQFLAVAILFAAYRLIINKRMMAYVVLVLILSTIHFSCVLLIPLYFIVQLRPYKFNTFAIIFGFILLCIFANPVINSLETALEGTAYSGFSTQFVSDDGVNPIRVVVAFVPVVLAFWKREKIFNDNNRFVEIAANMSILSACLYMFGIFTSGIIMGRLPIYCEVYNMVFLPYIIKKGFSGKEGILLEMGAIVGYFFYFYLQSGGWYYVSDFTGIVS